MKYQTTQSEQLIVALTKFSPQSSKTTLKQWVSEGRVLIDGMIARKMDIVLEPGQTITLGSKVRYLESGVRLLYEDSDIMVIEKPAGLLSVATDFQTSDTAHAVLKREFRNRTIHVVHRLDQETSGVMMFACSDKGKEGMKELFAKHDLIRQYMAIVEGHLDTAEGTWTSYLYEMPNYKVYVTNDTQKGQIAITHYLVEAVSRRHSRLKLTLETGRKNQIRVQCQEAGHPVIGDRKYGSLSDPIKRLALHAHRLEFIHPVSGKKLAFLSPAPESFEKLVRGSLD